MKWNETVKYDTQMSSDYNFIITIIIIIIIIIITVHFIAHFIEKPFKFSVQ